MLAIILSFVERTCHILYRPHVSLFNYTLPVVHFTVIIVSIVGLYHCIALKEPCGLILISSLQFI